MTGSSPNERSFSERISTDDFESLRQFAISAQHLAMPDIILNGKLDRSARIILALSVSDLDDLFEDVTRGSGRASMRSARALIEHAINFATVLRSSQDSRRYLDHLDLGPLLLQDIDIDSSIISGRKRSMAGHALKKHVRVAEPRWREAIERYGSRFRINWHELTLATRADVEGLGELYKVYRLASSVAHGSAAGSQGHYMTNRNDRGSYIMGRSPQMVPLALFAGISAHLSILAMAEQCDRSIDLSMARDALQPFLAEQYVLVWDAAWEVSRTIVSKFDQEVPSVMFYLTFSRSGKCRGYVEYEKISSKWFRIRESAASRDFADGLSSIIEAYVSGGGEFGPGGLAAIEFANVTFEIEFSKPTLAGSAVFPRLIPNDELTEWEIAVGMDAAGNYQLDGRLAARAGD